MENFALRLGPLVVFVQTSLVVVDQRLQEDRPQLYLAGWPYESVHVDVQSILCGSAREVETAETL